MAIEAFSVGVPRCSKNIYYLWKRGVKIVKITLKLSKYLISQPNMDLILPVIYLHIAIYILTIDGCPVPQNTGQQHHPLLKNSIPHGTFVV